MTARELNEDFRDLLLAFADENVEFLVVGAHAIGFHGLPRATRDLYVFVRPSLENSRRVYGALAKFGAPLESARIETADFAAPGCVYQIGLPPRRIDVLTELTGVSFDEALEGRGTLILDGRRIHYIGREALIQNKEALGRPQDLADVARLRSQKQ
ncbi:MAG TPA: hypothetical protein VLK65_02190 [Vicinamibacteria bacterium]|nr:hypothetical protein [Vicinamibacteria bacterium]